MKIADFGVAKAHGELAHRLTAAGTTLGTPAYMTPEQAMGREAGLRTDLYSLGVVAYELLVGELPFQGKSWMVLLKQIYEPVPAPRERRPELDRSRTASSRAVEQDGGGQRGSRSRARRPACRAQRARRSRSA